MGRDPAAEAQQAPEARTGMGDHRPGDCPHEQTLCARLMPEKVFPFFRMLMITIRLERLVMIDDAMSYEGFSDFDSGTSKTTL